MERERERGVMGGEGVGKYEIIVQSYVDRMKELNN